MWRFSRQSSPLLTSIVKRAAEILNTNVMNFGRRISLKKICVYLIFIIELLTTPQLHYIVRCYNDNGLYGQCTEAGYFEKLCTSFQKLIQVERKDLSI